MAADSEVRVAVGEQMGRRSTVWKFAAYKADVYIFTRMFGRDAKVSLHASGQCQWSKSGDWVRKAPGRRNADRHTVQWVVERPTGSPALHVFDVWIPETDLRPVPEEDGLELVNWLPAPPAGTVLSLECYITRPSDVDPSLASGLPHPRLFSFALTDGRWFVVLCRIRCPAALDLTTLRYKIWNQTIVAGIELRPQLRAAAFFKEDEGTARGLVELGPPTEAADPVPSPCPYGINR